MKNKLDIFYIILAGVVLIIDIFTKSEAIEALGFVLIVFGFIFSVMPNKTNIKDERISYIKLFSGYVGFMITIIVICLLLFTVRYTNFNIVIADLLRYIMLLMYFVFSSTYAISKRKL